MTIILIVFNFRCMIVCICKAVSDKRIRRLVGEGAISLRDVSRELGVGTCCGKCVPHAREVLIEALAAQPMKLAELTSMGMGQAMA
ncbi:MAG: bacterioferritin-associated ferredoxin [Panacagrimonas sp.]